MEITGSIKRVREQVREWRKAGLTVWVIFMRDIRVL